MIFCDPTAGGPVTSGDMDATYGKGASDRPRTQDRMPWLPDSYYDMMDDMD